MPEISYKSVQLLLPAILLLLGRSVHNHEIDTVLRYAMGIREFYHMDVFNHTEPLPAH